MRRTVFSAMVAVAVLMPAAVVTAQSADASAMAQRIGGRLKESGLLHDYRVAIKYVDGVACLTGSVTSPEQAETAVRLTQQVPGVSHVVNELEITGGGQMLPAEFHQPDGAREQNQQAGYQPRPFPQGASRPQAPNSRNWQAEQGTSGNQQIARRPSPQGQPGNGGQQISSNQNPGNGRNALPPEGQRTRQPNNMRNMPMPAHMAGRQQGQQPGRQPMNQQAMAQRRAMAHRDMMAQRAYAQQAMGQQQQQPMQAQYCPPGPGGPGGMGPGAMGPGGPGMGPMPSGYVPGGNVQAASYDTAQMPGYAWPSYASHPNYAALTYPKQYSPSAWPYIGPFYPYPQVPLGWRKVSLEWDDGWWFLDFSDRHSAH
jgi:hypothetical protein